ncbi:hypothetical protein D9758_008031 [Tetrapyrgos nigripes]|uniref:Uncharacterized protein n=1 Tax=Tetrapyrgos nigripes TaxID=182062 RepID=A0A8H5FWB9_9AGAR|nr:hypothetical protein D9758_008031 [Tetrapyrgos nigripes]
MTIPPLSELEELAKTIIYEAKENGLLHKMTNRTVREEIETRLSLESQVLNAPKFKKPLNNAVKACVGAIEEEKERQRGQDADDADNEISPKTNRVSKPKTNVVKEEDEQDVEEKDAEEEEEEAKESSSKKRKGKSETERPSRKRKSGKENGKDASAAGSSKKTSEKAKGKKNTETNFKSAEFVPPSSDVEEDAAMQGDSTAKDQEEDLSSADEGTPKPSSSKTKPPAKPLQVKSEPHASTNGDDSDTGLSDLIDEPPKKKSKGKTATKASGKKNEKPSNKKELSKDEETIKRLKGFINACGVRKPWSKLFDGIEDQPSKQIKMLRKILEDLGIEGRPSMEKAKAIKAKKELENELGKSRRLLAVSKQVTRSSRKAQEAEESDEGNVDEEDVNERPVKRKTNARQSIMAFLADQSDSE